MRPWPECRGQWGGAIGLCERDTLYWLTGWALFSTGRLKPAATLGLEWREIVGGYGESDGEERSEDFGD